MGGLALLPRLQWQATPNAGGARSEKQLLARVFVKFKESDLLRNEKTRRKKW